MGEHTMEASGGFYDNSVVFENVPPGNPGDFGIVENRWRIKHPVVTFFHLLFRTLAIIAYSSHWTSGLSRISLEGSWLDRDGGTLSQTKESQFGSSRRVPLRNKLGLAKRKYRFSGLG